jgi:hypothetical protein
MGEDGCQPEEVGRPRFDTIFTLRVSFCGSKFMAAGSIVDTMNSMVRRARQMSLALLVMAVIDHGHLQPDYSGATPGSSGLMRLGRDLMRRAGGDTATEVPASQAKMSSSVPIV